MAWSYMEVSTKRGCRESVKKLSSKQLDKFQRFKKCGKCHLIVMDQENMLRRFLTMCPRSNAPRV